MADFCKMPVGPVSSKEASFGSSRRAFTLMEMVVALGILAIVMSFAGVIFRVSNDAHRLALANAEIMQKLRAITEQLDADFRGLRKDGEVVAFWRAARNKNYVEPDLAHPNPNAEEAFDRFDRIMFFADGDFQTYGVYGNPAKPTRGSMAWICYTLANEPSSNPSNPDPNRPENQRPEKRVLARVEHILVPPPATANPSDPLGMGTWTDSQWRDWMSVTEYDAITMHGWGLIDLAQKANILSVIGDTKVDLPNASSNKNAAAGGVTLDPAKPQSLCALLCKGVGHFEVQGWSDAEKRWIPSVNPNGDASLTDDSDFILQGGNLDPLHIPGVWYPRGPAVLGQGRGVETLDGDFNKTPGLGRALKFTFTLYDSRGLIKNGRTFTHIVYVDN